MIYYVAETFNSDWFWTPRIEKCCMKIFSLLDTEVILVEEEQAVMTRMVDGTSKMQSYPKSSKALDKRARDKVPVVGGYVSKYFSFWEIN